MSISGIASLFGGGNEQANIERRQKRASIAGEQKLKSQQEADKQKRLKGKAGRLALIKTSPAGILENSSTGRGKLLGN